MSAQVSASCRVEDPVRVWLSGVVAVAVVSLFHFFGNAADVSRFGSSAFGWMVTRWGDATVSVGDYSHGWILPLVSLFAIWQRRLDFAAAQRQVCWPGLWLVAFALVMHFTGFRAQQPRISLAAFILLAWSIPLFLEGKQVAKLLVFPCAYLLFCIPLNFLDELSFHLRMIVTVVSSIVLNGLGVATERVGSALFCSSAGGIFSLDVADPCSGIRSLLAITALAAGYSYFTQKVLWKKWVLFLLSIPMAVAGNIARVITIGIVAHVFGQKRAMDFYHDYSGYIVFVVVILLLMGVGDVLGHRSTSGINKVSKGQHS